MSTLFGGNRGVQQEDPNVAAMRQREQQRAEEDKIKNTQDQLGVETRLRSRQYGVRSLFDAGAGAKSSLLGSG